MAKKGPTKKRAPATKPCAYCRKPTTVTFLAAQLNTEFARMPHSPVPLSGYPPICSPDTTKQVALEWLRQENVSA